MGISWKLYLTNENVTFIKGKKNVMNRPKEINYRSQFKFREIFFHSLIIISRMNSLLGDSYEDDI